MTSRSSSGDWNRAATDQLLGIMTLVAGVVITTVAMIISYRRTYELVRSHGDSCRVDRLVSPALGDLIWAALTGKSPHPIRIL